MVIELCYWYMLIVPSAEEDIYDVINEISSLAGRWRNMCLALRLLPSDETTIASSCRDNPDECLKAVLIKWLKKCYNTQKHGPPTWQKLVAAVANSTGGDNPALAKQISEKHQGEHLIMMHLHGEYCDVIVVGQAGMCMP